LKGLIDFADILIRTTFIKT